MGSIFFERELIQRLHGIRFSEDVVAIIVWQYNSAQGGYDYSPGQNMRSKIEKSSKTGQDKKSLISLCACFLTAIAKV